MGKTIWDFWAKRYDRLWVQKHSLKPTRDLILKKIEEEMNNINKWNTENHRVNLLDIGCGTGELIYELNERYESFNLSGVDFSKEMISVSENRNPDASHIKMDVEDLDKIEDRFSIITCTHSLPYYKNLDKFVGDIYNLLEKEGRIFIAFASGDSLYDKIVLSFVKLSTGIAHYPSDKEFRELLTGKFKVESLDLIKERFFMPRLAIYKLSKVKL